jgi:ABC-type transporter Mla subunit MlaD
MFSVSPPTMALQDLTPQLRTRLSRMERAVGWFVILATLLLVFGFGYYVYKTAERKGWFKIKAPYYTFTDRATGLKEGDPVQMMGFDVGQITRITSQPPEDYEHNVYVEFEIKEPYYGYLWTVGSRAKVTTADLLGKRLLEVTKGTGGHATYVFNPLKQMTLAQAGAVPDPQHWRFAEDLYDLAGTNLLVRAMSPLSKAGLATAAARGLTEIRLLHARELRQKITAVWNERENRYETFGWTNRYWLKSDETPAVTERLEKLVREVEKSLPNILNLTNQLAAMLSNGATLASNLDLVAGEARPAVSNLALVAAQLNQPGALGDWLLPTNLNANLNALAESLGTSLDNLAGITGNLNQQVQDNTNILSALSRAVVDADNLVQGLKRHWLLRSAFKGERTNAPAALTNPPLRSPKDRQIR